MYVGSILLMFKMCDSLIPGAELKLLKICGGKTFAGLQVLNVVILLFRYNGYKETRAWSFLQAENPPGAMLKMSGRLRVLGVVRAPSLVLSPCCWFVKWHQTHLERPVSGGILRTLVRCVWEGSERGFCGMPWEVSGWNFSEWVCGRSSCGVSVGLCVGSQWGTPYCWPLCPWRQAKSSGTCSFLCLVVLPVFVGSEQTGQDCVFRLARPTFCKYWLYNSWDHYSTAHAHRETLAWSWATLGSSSV